MKLLVGLGNPEEKYTNNRHNVGFLFVDRLQNFETFNLNKQVKSLVSKNMSNNWLLAKPQTFMNDSGRAVRLLLDYYKVAVSDLYVIHDDLDIALGQYKIQKGKGPKIHNGILSIEEQLGATDFWRVRIGVDNRDPNNRTIGHEYVLSDFTSDELSTLKGVFESIKNELV